MMARNSPTQTPSIWAWFVTDIPPEYSADQPNTAADAALCPFTAGASIHSNLNTPADAALLPFTAGTLHQIVYTGE